MAKKLVPLVILCVTLHGITALEQEKKFKPDQMQAIEAFFSKQISPLELAVQTGKIQQVKILLKSVAVTEAEIRAALKISREKHSRKITWHLLQKLAQILPLQQQ